MKKLLQNFLLVFGLVLVGGAAMAVPVITYSATNTLSIGVAGTVVPTTATGISTFGYGAGIPLTATGLNYPWGEAYDGTNLYVANTNANTILKYTNATGTAATFITAPAAGTYGNVSSVVYDGSTYFYVATTYGYVFRYPSTGGTTATTIVTGGNGNATKPFEIFGMAIDASGNLYMADPNTQCIYKYTSGGTTAKLILTGTGTNSNYLVQPVGVQVDANGNIYTLDYNTNLIAKWSSTGTYISTVVPTGTFTGAYGLSMDKSGNFYVGDPGNSKVYAFNSTGTLLATISTTGNTRGVVTDAAGDLFVSDGTANTVIKYPITGGYILNYGTSTSSLPPGITFNSLNGQFSGTATATFTGNYTVTVYGTGGPVTSAQFAINCTLPPPTVSYAATTPTPPYTGTNTFYQGITFTGNITPTSTNVKTNGFAISPTLPAGLSFSAATGAITGTPTVTSASQSYTVTVTGTTGLTGTTSFNLSVVLPPAPTSLSYTPAPDYFFTQGMTITTLVPTVGPTGTLLPSSGAYVLTLTSAPGTPITSINGLTFSTTTGQLSGMPTGTQAATNYTVTVSNAGGSASTPFNITIYPAVPIIAYNPSSYSFATGVASTIAAPTSTGGAVVTYSFASPASVPSYITINSTTGAIMVSNLSVASSGTYTVNATNSNPMAGTTTVTISIGPKPNISYSPSNPYTVGTVLTLPVNNAGGAVPTGGVTYSSSIYTPLPATGLINPWDEAFDASGNLYVVNEGTTNSVNEYSSTGAYLGNFITNSGAITLTNPTGIVFYGGNAYISTLAGYVYKYNSSGVYQSTIVTGGAGAATKPASAYGLAVDATGDLYITDYTSGYIYKYTNGGTTAIIAKYTNTTGLYDPSGIAVDASGNVYFVDIADNDLVKLSSTGVYQSTIVTGLSSPYGLSIDAAGNFYITNNTSHTVQVYSSGGSLTTTINTTGTSPVGVISDSYGNIYVTDHATPSEIKYPPVSGYVLSGGSLPAGITFSTSTGLFSGTPTAAFGPVTFTVTGYNSFGSSTCMVIIQCSVKAPMIAYSPNSVVYPVNVMIASLSPNNTGGPIITANTGFQSPGTTFATIAAANAPWGMTTDSYGDIFVANYGAKTIVEYSSTGSVLLTIATSTYNPTGVAVDAAGNIYAVMSNGYVYKFNSAGVGGIFFTNIETNDGNRANSGLGIAVDGSGNLYISDGYKGYIWQYLSSANTIGALLTGVNPEGIVTDASGNFYFVDLTAKSIREYSAAGALVATPVTGLSTPYGLYRDASGNFYVGGSTAAGSVSAYTSTGTLIGTVTGQSSPRGIVTDIYGNMYVSDYTLGNITEYPAYLYTINTAVQGPLPAGITFNPVTGTFSGKPTAAFGPVTFTVTAKGFGGTTSSTPVTIQCIYSYDWIGAISSDWNATGNWESGTVPTSANTASIGVNYAFTNQPTVGLSAPATVNVGAIAIGNSGGKAVTLSVNSGYILNVSGNVTKQSDANSSLGYVSGLSGLGTLKAINLSVIANTNAAAGYTEGLYSSLMSLQLSGNVNLTSTFSTYAYNAAFNVTGGVTSVAGYLYTLNGSASSSSFSVANGTLQLAIANPLANLSSNGTNITSFQNPGATIEYSGGNQFVYTDAAVTNLSNTFAYQNIKFSGTGVKTPTSGNLFIPGDFTNALTLNDGTSNYINLTATPVYFNGSIAQNIYGGNGTGTTFSSLNFNGTNTTTIKSGNANVASTGTLTMSGSAQLAAGGFLTLNSDANGNAAVAPITSGTPISGTVNVQRYITGERGYRLMSSPVYAGAVSGNNVYSLNYLVNSLYVTGTGTGFSATGNPTLFLYDEGFVPQYSTFFNSNFVAISSLSSGGGTQPAYYLNTNGAGLATASVPVGNGFYNFFRGNLSEGTVNLTNPTYQALAATVTATGILTQGQVTVADWYSPSSAYLGDVSQKFNLIGNPYASAIDLGTVATSTPTSGIYMTPFNSGGTTGVSKFVYELNPVSGVYGQYITDGTLPATNGATQYIASGQGFFVLALGPNSAQVVFNENGKATTTNATVPGLMVTRHVLAAVVPGAVNPLLRLKMTLDSVHNEESLITFNPASKPQYVFNEDAPHQTGQGLVGFSSTSADNIKLAINSMPLLQTQTIPLNVYATNDGLYTIGLQQLHQLPSLYDIWLKDAYQKDSLDIKNNPVYSFNILHTDTNSFGTKRFTLVIRQNPALMVHLLSFTVNKVTPGDQVTWTTENEQNYTNFAVQRSTDGGKTFTLLEGIVSSAQGTYSYLDKNPVQGANSYRLQLTDLNGTITYSNIVTIMYANTGNQIAINGMMLYPNPTSGTVNLAIDQSNTTQATANSVATTYNIQIINNLGSIIKTAVSSSPNWQTDVSTLIPGTYFIRVTNAGTNSVVGKSAFVKL